MQAARLGSYGQLQQRTHYAVDQDAVVAALGYEDFMELRRTRPEIDDAVVPYIKELQGRELSADHWFFVEIMHAEGVKASDVNYSGADTSDAYCVIFLNDKIIGKTEVKPDTRDPVWRYSVAMTRAEVKKWGDKAETLEVRFEVYDHDNVGNPDFLGEVVTDLTELSQRDDFWAWTPTDEAVESTFKLQERQNAETGQCEESEGTITIRLSNDDQTSTIHPRISSPDLKLDLARRTAQHKRRHIYVTDEAADIAELKEQVGTLQEQVGEILTLLKDRAG